MVERLDIVGIGAINVDYIATRSLLQKLSTEFKDELRDSFERGSEIAVSLEDAKEAIDEFGRTNLRTFLGGSALLTIQSLSWLHADLNLGYVGVCGNVSAHIKSFEGWWDRMHVDDRWVLQEPDQDPGLCVSYILDRERTLRTTPCANREMAKHLSDNFEAIANYVAQAKIVHVSSFLDPDTPAVLALLLKAAKARNPGLRVSFDPGHCWIPPGEPVSQILALTDYLFLNDREFNSLAQPKPVPIPMRSLLDRAEQIIRRCNRGTAILHLHSYDAVSMYYYFGGELRERRFGEKAKPETIEDATGAGDVFAAGFLSCQCAPGFSPSDGIELGLRLAHQKLLSPGSSSFPGFSNVLHIFMADVLSRSRELAKQPVICFGHGRDSAWKSVLGHLRGTVMNNVDVVNFETDELPGREATDILRKMLERATFAVVLMTAEDRTADGRWRARQNVVHEVGLFQGRLGFEKVVMLVDEKIEKPTNLFGVLHVPFAKIEDTFEKLDRALAVAGLSSLERPV